jgi:hypothetical protein
MVESLHVIGQKGFSIDEWIFYAMKHFQIQRKTWFIRIGPTLGSTHEVIALHGCKKLLCKMPTIQQWNFDM